MTEKCQISRVPFFVRKQAFSKFPFRMNVYCLCKHIKCIFLSFGQPSYLVNFFSHVVTKFRNSRNFWIKRGKFFYLHIFDIFLIQVMYFFIKICTISLFLGRSKNMQFFKKAKIEQLYKCGDLILRTYNKSHPIFRIQHDFNYYIPKCQAVAMVPRKIKRGPNWGLIVV